MDNPCESEDTTFSPSYCKYWEIYSEALVREFSEARNGSNAKILLFPLNSHYVMKKYMQQTTVLNRKNDNYRHNMFVNIANPELINFLFEHIIY
jgi:hypothetical protein